MTQVAHMAVKSHPSSRSSTSGVVLSFDDYSDSWVRHLPLFERLGIRTTFFVTGEFMRDEREAEARLCPLLQAGHALGAHTFSHRRATEAWADEGQNWLEQDVLEQARILSKLSGKSVASFAYPNGDHDDTTDRILGPHFHFLRAFGKKVVFTTERELVAGGVVYATSIDNHCVREPSWLDEQLAIVSRAGQIWPVASHHVNDSKWGIAPERLTQFVEACRRFDVPIFCFDDFLP